MNLITYVPKRDKSGKFTNFKKKALKVLKFQLILLSVLANLYFLKHDYVVNCVATIDGVKQTWNLGHFESRQTCDQLVSDRISNLAQK